MLPLHPTNITTREVETPNTKTTVEVWKDTGEVFYTFCRRVGVVWQIVRQTKFTPRDPEAFAAVLLGAA